MEKQRRRIAFRRVLFGTFRVVVLLFGIIIILGLTYNFLKKLPSAFKVKKSDEISQGLKIVFFDVSQGDSALITTPSGKNILIDGGPSSAITIDEGEGKMVSDFDAGKKVLVPYFEKKPRIVLLGKTHLDYVIVTHPHSDHYGGLISLIESGVVSIGTIIEPGIDTSDPQFLEFLKLADKNKIKFEIPEKNYTMGLENDIKLLFYNVGKIYKDTTSDINNSSIVIKLIYKNFSVLFTGDIEKPAELDIISQGIQLKSTILKCPHHGSMTSSTEPFIDAVSPEGVVISYGRKNAFGHPHEETLEKYKERDIKIYKTGEEGDITVLSNGETYKVVTKKWFLE